MKVFPNNVPVQVLKEATSNKSLLQYKLNEAGRQDKDDPFFVCDLGDIVRKYKIWMSKLPRVEPHYAVKCNDDPMVLRLLANLGTGFDCASKSEIQKILDLKVSPSRIVYANPCKQSSYIKYATRHGVHMTTFDNEAELHKIKAINPDAQLIIRILPPDESKSQCQFGMKFGVHPKHALKLLKVARDLQLNVIGVSFHVGSGCNDATAFAAAVASARTVFDMGEVVGYKFHLLDIGGGFPGQESANVSFSEIVDVLSPALDLYFPPSSGVRIIAEPGRYFVASAFAIAVNVIAKRVVPRDTPVQDGELATANDEPSFMYYVNDGVYGSFNCVLYDHATVEAKALQEDSEDAKYTCSVWGPTCDGLDCILDPCQLPELDIGDWMYFEDMGAYTMVAGSCFNGMPKPRVFHVINENYMPCLNINNKKEYNVKKDNMLHCGSTAVLSDHAPVFQDQYKIIPEN